MIKFFKFSFTDYALPGQLGFQPPASPVMRGIIDLHHHIMFFLIIVLVFTFTMLYYTLKDHTIVFEKYKKYNQIKQLYNIKITHHTILETLWIIFPSLILLAIALPSFALLYAMDEAVESMITLKVTGHQWYWSYEIDFWANVTLEGSNNQLRVEQVLCNYGFDSYMVPTNELSKDGLRLLETTNPIILPVKTYIKVLVGASDVLHSWAVPSLGIKIDAVPGRINEVTLYADRIGRFYGQCSELCGVNHGFMPIEIYIIPRDEFLNLLPEFCDEYRMLFLKIALYNSTNSIIKVLYTLLDWYRFDNNFMQVWRPYIYKMSGGIDYFDQFCNNNENLGEFFDNAHINLFKTVINEKYKL